MHKILLKKKKPTTAVTVEVHKTDFIKILLVHVHISEVKRVNKAHGKKRELVSVDGAITLGRQRDIEQPMRGVRGGTTKSFLTASVLPSALGGGERETLVMPLHPRH